MEQVGRFNDDPAWRGERLRDVIAAREVIIEINRMLYEGLADRRASLDDVLDEDDIDGLASTVPYCDIVVTDKEAASHLIQTGVAGRFQTTVLSRVGDLIPVLESAAS